MKKESIGITRAQAKKVLDIIDAGLVNGIGNYKKGDVCVEAAVCLAFGEGRSNDAPKCVDPLLRQVKITINDAAVWESLRTEAGQRKARARALRRLGIIQLGSINKLNHTKFINLLLTLAIKGIIKEGIVDDSVLDRLKGITTIDELVTKKEILVASNASCYNTDIAGLLYCIGYAGYTPKSLSEPCSAEKLTNMIVGKMLTPRALAAFCEKLVQGLLPFNLPGAKWLSLTEE